MNFLLLLLPLLFLLPQELPHSSLIIQSDIPQPDLQEQHPHHDPTEDDITGPQHSEPLLLRDFPPLVSERAIDPRLDIRDEDTHSKDVKDQRPVLEVTQLRVGLVATDQMAHDPQERDKGDDIEQWSGGGVQLLVIVQDFDIVLVDGTVGSGAEQQQGVVGEVREEDADQETGGTGNHTLRHTAKVSVS